MTDWVEYAIARHAAQLRNLAAVRTLTEREQGTLAVCESVINRVEARETLGKRPRWSRRSDSYAAPLVKSAHHD